MSQEDIVRYKDIKNMLVSEIYDYLDVQNKKNLLKKMTEQIEKQNQWKKDIDQKPPQKIL